MEEKRPTQCAEDDPESIYEHPWDALDDLRASFAAAHDDIVALGDRSNGWRRDELYSIAIEMWGEWERAERMIKSGRFSAVDWADMEDGARAACAMRGLPDTREALERDVWRFARVYSADPAGRVDFMRGIHNLLARQDELTRCEVAYSISRAARERDAGQADMISHLEAELDSLKRPSPAV